MPKEVYIHSVKTCKKNSKIGLLATEGTLKTGIYNKFFDKKFKLINPSKSVQKNNINKAIKLVKMGKIKDAEKAIHPAVNELIKMKCNKIILGCTELPIAIFAFKSFKKINVNSLLFHATQHIIGLMTYKRKLKFLSLVCLKRFIFILSKLVKKILKLDF